MFSGSGIDRENLKDDDETNILMIHKLTHAYIYKYVIGSSMNLYLCHDLWINMVVYFFVWPYCDRKGGSMSFYVGIFIILILTEAGCVLNYYLVNKLYNFLVPNQIKNNTSYDKMVA